MINKLLNNNSADYALFNSRGFNRDIGVSLRRLGSGLRINTAIDDSSSIQIADNLKLQFKSNKQAARNAEQTADIVKIATDAIKQQTDILSKIKTSAIQARQDSLDKETKVALQKEIHSLIKQLDSIAVNTKYNGRSLLTGNFSDKKFQIGATSRDTASLSFSSITSEKIGTTSILSYNNIGDATSGTLDITIPETGQTVKIQATISTSAGTGIGVLVDKINSASDKLGGLKARYKVDSPLEDIDGVEGSSFTNMTINGVSIPDITNIKAFDSDGRIINTINKYTQDTGVEAYRDDKNIRLRSIDGRGIETKYTYTGNVGNSEINSKYYGRITFSRPGSQEIKISTTDLSIGSSYNQVTYSLKDIGKRIGLLEMRSIGVFSDGADIGTIANGGVTSTLNVLSKDGAVVIQDIIENSIKDITENTSDIGSNYQALVIASDNNLAQVVSTQSAHTELVGVDFAVESSNFNKSNILAQAGTYALNKAQQIATNIFKLLEV